MTARLLRRLSPRSILIAALFLSMAAAASAQQLAPTEPDVPVPDVPVPDVPVPDVPFAPNIAPSLAVRRATGPITIDGRLDDAGWAGAATAGNFAETYPRDMARPPVETTAMITYDDRNLYIGFIAKDDPSTIRASLHDRDEQWNEDYCGIMLDTYGNASWGYELFVNALGVQGDLLMPNNADEDSKFDIVFEAKSTITADGYLVEVAVPFSSLRFPDNPAQIWKATFWRIHPRASRQEYSWAAISRDNPCLLCQFGTLTGIENVKPGGALELLPGVVASKSGTRQDAASPLAYGPISSSVSLGARYAFTPSITAEMTFNPDFSQVESDAAKVDVNSTFALFYPERRPFFQEGSDLFDGWLETVYTRSINAPKVAAKLIGRMGSTTLGYLGAYDEHTPFLIPDEERSYLLQGGGSFSTIARARQMFDANSFIGAMVTDRRCQEGGSGTLLSLDALYRFLGNYQIEIQGALSLTAEPNAPEMTAELDGLTFDRGRHTISFDGERYVGNGIYASLERHARDWGFDFDYWDRSPAFRAFNGFETRSNRRETNLWAGYTIYPELSFLDRIEPSMTAGRVWNYDGLRKDEWLVPAINFNFKAQTWLRLAYLYSNERYKGYDMDNIRYVEVNLNSNFSQLVSLGMDLTIGHTIARSLEVPVLGRSTDLNLFGTLRIFDRLNIQPTLTYATMKYPDTEEHIYDGFISRTRFNYQWSKELFLRLVVQYDTFDKSLSIEPLLTYKLNPFTIFYAGSTHALDENESPGGLNGRLSSQQFFIKGQYLVQI